MTDTLGDWKRTHYCGELRATDADREATVMGWVHRRRDHGHLIFLDLRDRSGLLQLVIDRERAPEAHRRAESVRGEYVVAARGTVVRRSRPNPQLPTGEIELLVQELRLLNVAQPVPFAIEDETTASEETASATAISTCAGHGCSATWHCDTVSLPPCGARSMSWASTRSRRRFWRGRHPRAHATTWSPAASIPATSTPCPSHPSSSSRS